MDRRGGRSVRDGGTKEASGHLHACFNQLPLGLRAPLLLAGISSSDLIISGLLLHHALIPVAVDGRGPPTLTGQSSAVVIGAAFDVAVA
jgi:hypothetical protein